MKVLRILLSRKANSIKSKNPGKTLILELEVRVRDNTSNNSIIANTAQIAVCEDLLDSASCFVTLETTPVYDMVLRPYESDFDGDVDGSDLAIFATDFGRTDCPLP